MNVAALECNGPKDAAGWLTVGGTMLEPQSDGRELAIGVRCRKSERIITFDLVTGRNADGTANFKTLDEKRVTATKRDDVLLDSMCEWNGAETSSVIAFGSRGKDGVNTVVKVWRANPESGKLEPVSPSEIVCREIEGE